MNSMKFLIFNDGKYILYEKNSYRNPVMYKKYYLQFCNMFSLMKTIFG